MHTFLDFSFFSSSFTFLFFLEQSTAVFLGDVIFNQVINSSSQKYLSNKQTIRSSTHPYKDTVCRHDKLENGVNGKGQAIIIGLC